MNQYSIYIISYVHDTHVRGDMGGHRKVWEIAEALKHAGHRVTVFVSSHELCPPDLTVRIVQVPIINFPVIRPFSFNFFLFFKMLVRLVTDRPHLIYCRPIISIVPLVAARMCGAKIFFETNNNPYQKIKKSLWSRYYYWWLVNQINYRWCDSIVSINMRVKELILATHALRPAHIRLVENATNERLFAPQDMGACKTALGIDVNRFVAGFVGTLFEYQGVRLIIEAAPRIIQEIGQVLFLIVGEGVMRAAWEQEVRDKGLSEFFLFTGQVPYREVANYINAMDITLSPLHANRDEASPLKVYDCLSCGKPVVVSRIKPLEELIAQISALVVFQADDPGSLAETIIALARDPERVSLLGTRSREFICDGGHTWQNNAAQLIRLYESLKEGTNA